MLQQLQPCAACDASACGIGPSHSFRQPAPARTTPCPRLCCVATSPMYPHVATCNQPPACVNQHQERAQARLAACTGRLPQPATQHCSAPKVPPLPACLPQVTGVKVDAQQRLIEVLAPMASMVLRSAVAQVIADVGLLVMRTSACGALPPATSAPACCSGAAAPAASHAALVLPPTPATARLSVEGMSCASCSSGIEQQLGSMPGVAAVTVALLTHQCTVQYDASVVSVQQLAEAIDEMGFEAAVLEEKLLEAGNAAGEAVVKVAVGGMSCASCVVAVEGLLQARPGVRAAVVSLVTGQAVVKYQPELVGPRDIIEMLQVGGSRAGAVDLHGFTLGACCAGDRCPQCMLHACAQSSVCSQHHMCSSACMHGAAGGRL
jgi:copper ion binding protein